MFPPQEWYSASAFVYISHGFSRLFYLSRHLPLAHSLQSTVWFGIYSICTSSCAIVIPRLPLKTFWTTRQQLTSKFSFDFNFSNFNSEEMCIEKAFEVGNNGTSIICYTKKPIFQSNNSKMLSRLSGSQTASQARSDGKRFWLPPHPEYRILSQSWVRES